MSAIEHEVFGDRERADEAIFLAVLRHEPDAGVQDAADAPADELGSVERGRAPHDLLEADQRLRELGLPIALHTRDGEDLATADLETDVVDDGVAGVVEHRQVRDHESGVAQLRRILVDREFDGPADHHRRELGVR